MFTLVIFHQYYIIGTDVTDLYHKSSSQENILTEILCKTDQGYLETHVKLKNIHYFLLRMSIFCQIQIKKISHYYPHM